MSSVNWATGPAKISPLANVWSLDLILEALRTTCATGTSKLSPEWELGQGDNHVLLEMTERLSHSLHYYQNYFLRRTLVNRGLILPWLSSACANAQAFPTDGANCKDSICNDPQFVLSSYVKGLNKKFVEGGLNGLALMNGRSLVMVFKMHAQKWAKFIQEDSF